MNKIKLFSVVILIFSTLIYAQNDSINSNIKVDTTFIIKVNPKLPPFIIHFNSFSVRYKRNDPYFGKIYYTIEIKNAKNE